MTISHLTVDGQMQIVQVNSADRSRETKPLRISTSARAIEFHFTEGDRTGQPTARLRFRLDGQDDTWRDLPSRMRADVRFQDRQQQVVGGTGSSMDGESPGWRGTVEDSEFLPCRVQATVPERSATARIAFHTFGGEAGIGVVGIDAMQVLVEHPGVTQPEVFDLSVKAGTDLHHPLGSPELWMREGSRADLSQLRTRPTPSPHPLLVLEDDDPNQYGCWSLKREKCIPVRPGDRLTFEWQMAYSIGRCGPGQATYPRLKPGRYWFRVAAAKANGELTGQEVSLPIEVVAPWYQRWEFWLVGTALAGAAAVGTRQLVLRRRIQSRLLAIEHEQELERERARIARDLHDDIGAGLSEIAMQSDWVRRDLAQGPTANTQRRIEHVCQSAIELTRSVDEIVWAVTPANDTLPRFANYLTQTTEQFLDAAGLRVRFDLPPELPAVALPGKVRHFLFLAVREALNNVTKHARADLVRLEMVIKADGLRLAIEDNGVGFDRDQVGAVGTHEGMDSMRRRMEEIRGQFHVTSRPGGGTRVEFFAPLRKPESPG